MTLIEGICDTKPARSVVDEDLLRRSCWYFFPTDTLGKFSSFSIFFQILVPIKHNNITNPIFPLSDWEREYEYIHFFFFTIKSTSDADNVRKSNKYPLRKIKRDLHTAWLSSYVWDYTLLLTEKGGQMTGVKRSPTRSCSINPGGRGTCIFFTAVCGVFVLCRDNANH